MTQPSHHVACSSPFSLPPHPYLAPGWMAAYLAGLLAWLALYKLGGWFFFEVVAALVLVLLGTLGLLNTCSDPHRGDLPRARAVRLGGGV